MKRFCTFLALLFLIGLPVFTSGAPIRRAIIRADYGFGDHWTEVTQRVLSLIRGDTLNIRVDNATLGVDPAPGEGKALRLQVLENGNSRQLTYQENEYASLVVNSAGNTDSSGLQILNALYGAGNRVIDVTNRLSYQIQGGQLNMQVTNATMGGDPAPGQGKTLRVGFAYNGNQSQVVVNEGDSLSLPSGNLSFPGGNSASNGPQILNAVYGSGNRVIDVTNRLSYQIQGGQLNMQVTNATMGGDPAPGQGKTLTVGFAYNGNQSQVVVNEGDNLSLPSGMGTNVGSYGPYTIIPSGTQLAIRTDEVIDSRTARTGQQFSAVTIGDIRNSSGGVGIPSGSNVQLVIRTMAGSNMVLDADSVVVSGQRYVISTADLQEKGRQGLGVNTRTAEMVGGGAAIGALIGALVGGGKGAAIGAGIGAGGGAGAEVLTKGSSVRVPAETILNFKLNMDLRLHPVR